MTAKLAALLPFGKVASFLAELLPLSASTNAAPVRNRTLRIGQRLERWAEKEERVALNRSPAAAVPELALGLEGAYVRSRHRRPEKHFEVIVGKVLGDNSGAATRFAFTTNHLDGAAAVRRALRHQGAGETTRLTVFSDGEAGLRELQRKIAPDATHILDWFHVAMRFEHLLNLAQGQPPPEPSSLVDMRAWSLGLIRRAKWALWHGQRGKTQAYLEDLCGWCQAKREQTPRVLVQMGRAASELLGYLEANRDSLPNYGVRYRAGLRISTAFAESAVNEVVARRMNKKTADALEPLHGPALSHRTGVRPQWHAGRRFPIHAPILPSGGHNLSVPQFFMLPRSACANASRRPTTVGAWTRRTSG